MCRTREASGSSKAQEGSKVKLSNHDDNRRLRKRLAVDTTARGVRFIVPPRTLPISRATRLWAIGQNPMCPKKKN